MDITRWSITKSDYILCSQRWRSFILSAKTRLGADCAQIISKFRFKLKKVGKTTRPFRHDLNQIPWAYTVGVTNRFKILYIQGIIYSRYYSQSSWRTMNGDSWHCTRGRDQNHPQGGGNAKFGSQEIYGVTEKFGLGVQNEADQRLTEFCQENALVITYSLFQQHKRWLYTWTSPDDQDWNQID